MNLTEARAALQQVQDGAAASERLATLRHIDLAQSIAEAAADAAHDPQIRLRCRSVAAALAVLLDDIRFERHIPREQ